MLTQIKEVVQVSKDGGTTLDIESRLNMARFRRGYRGGVSRDRITPPF